jgi:hypothetical protein
VDLPELQPRNPDAEDLHQLRRARPRTCGSRGPPMATITDADAIKRHNPGPT